MRSWLTANQHSNLAFITWTPASWLTRKKYVGEGFHNKFTLLNWYFRIRLFRLWMTRINLQPLVASANRWQRAINNTCSKILSYKLNIKFSRENPKGETGWKTWIDACTPIKIFWIPKNRLHKPTARVFYIPSTSWERFCEIAHGSVKLLDGVSPQLYGLTCCYTKKDKW